MGESIDFVKNADKLAGITTLILVGLGILQIILGELFLKSVALTANGIDCIGDGFVSGVVWIGLMFFKKPADDKFHYGYYKMENLASIAAAIVMILLAGYIIFRSYYQFIDPHEVTAPLFGLVVALIAAIIAIGLGIYKYKRGSKMGSVRLEAFNTIKDGAASGLTVVALVFDYFGYYIADAIVGFIIAGVIVTIGFAAIRESSFMLVDACDGECIDRSYVIKKIVEEIPEVESAHVVRLRRSGPVHQGEVEIKVSCDMTVREFNAIKQKIIKKVQARFPDVERLTVTAMTQEEN
ncbi:MAG: cation transporter [Candidatus Thermoplasmatota archaeon]|nr:cation transporter [Candidatus Thermoplasmatota archaeon]